MTVSSHDSILIARALGILYQIYPTPEEIAVKSDDKIRSLICTLKGEGFPAEEMLECFPELFPDGLAVTRGRNLLPMVHIGKITTSTTEVTQST